MEMRALEKCWGRLKLQKGQFESQTSLGGDCTIFVKMTRGKNKTKKSNRNERKLKIQDYFVNLEDWQFQIHQHVPAYILQIINSRNSTL